MSAHCHIRTITNYNYKYHRPNPGVSPIAFVRNTNWMQAKKETISAFSILISMVALSNIPLPRLL